MTALALDPGYDITPWARVVQVPDGTQGTVATLEIAADLARGALLDPLFAVNVKNRITAGARSRDYRDELSRIFRYNRANVRFTLDPLSWGKQSIDDHVQAPHYTWFAQGSGDCLAHAILAASQSLASGHGARFRVLKGDQSDPDRYSHVYAVLGYLDDLGEEHWVPADTTMLGHGFGYEVPEIEILAPADYVVAPAA